MIRNSINKLYIGISKNSDQRVQCHNAKSGASFTKYKRDFKLVFSEARSSLSDARKREIQIKKWRRGKKEFLIKKYLEGLPTRK